MKRARTAGTGAFADDRGQTAGVAPGKRARTDALPRAPAAFGATPAATPTSAPSSSLPDLSYEGLFGVSPEQMFGGASGQHHGHNAAANPANANVPASAAPLAAHDFTDVDVPWTITDKLTVEPKGASIDLHVGQINNMGYAELKPDVDAARGAGYTLGFVQTLISTDRASIYSENTARDAAYEARKEKIHDDHAKHEKKAGHEHTEPGVTEIEAGHAKHKANAPEYQRLVIKGGPLLDILGGPAPWYDASVNLALGGDGEAMITDHPRVTSPLHTPDGAGTLARVEGKDSFLTNFVAMPPGGGPPVFLAYATWVNTWNGEFDKAISHFHGGHVKVTGHGKGKGGSPVLTGAPANVALGNSATWTPPKKK